MDGLDNFMDIEKNLSSKGVDPEKLEELISPGIHQKMAGVLRGNMAKKHKYTHTTVTHHDDGSHTTTHHHEDGKSHKTYATGDHDSMIDGMMDHTSEPNPGEGQDVEGQAIGGGAAAGAPPAAPVGQGA